MKTKFLLSTFLSFLIFTACSKDNSTKFGLDPDLETTGGSITGGTTGSDSGDTTSGTFTGESSSGETTGESDGGSGSGSDSGSGSGSDEGTGLPPRGNFEITDPLTPGEFTGGFGGNGSGGSSSGNTGESGSSTTGTDSEGQSDGETSSGSTGGSAGDEESEIDVPENWELTALWRGMRVEFTDTGCKNHEIHSVGQYVNEKYTSGYWNDHDQSGLLELGITTNYQSKEKAKKSKPYQYRSYYTYLASNPNYIRIYQGKYTASNNQGTSESYDTTVNLSETLDGFTTPIDRRKIHVVLQGVYFNYENGSHKVGNLFTGISSTDFDEDNNKVNLTFNAAFGNDDNETSTITIYYAILVVDELYVQTVDDYYHFSYTCTDTSCWGDLDYSLNALDPDLYNTHDSVFFTATHQWGSSLLSLETLDGGSYYSGGNGSNSYKIKSIRGYASLEDLGNPSNITVNGEVYNESCADAKEAFPMNTITPTLLVCMDDRICKARQGWADWQDVDPSDTETATHTLQFTKSTLDFDE